MKLKKPIAVGYMSAWPTRKIVKVKIEPSDTIYPFRVSAVDLLEKFESFPIPDPSFINLYKSEKAAEKSELEKLHQLYATERRNLRIQQKRYKWALRLVEDYKHFGELQTPHFVV